MELKKDFAFDKNVIGVKDLINDAEQLIKQGNEIRDKQTNRFPVEAFPEPVQQIITATNECLNFPIDFIGASMLFAVSVAIGNTHRIEDNWQENAVLYLALVGSPGTNKSHPLSFALKPIEDEDKRTYAQYVLEKKEYDKAVNLFKKEKNKGVDEPVKPILKQYLLSDFTPEALAEVHKNNNRGVGIYADELAGWINNFNRYSKGSEEQFWLTNWSGKSTRVNRKTYEPIFIPFPFIPVCGTIQPGVLNELAKEGRTQNGFMDRILFVKPDNLQKPYRSKVKLNPAFVENWRTLISNLLDLSIINDDNCNPCPEVLKLTPEAEQIMEEWVIKNTDQCNDAENDAIKGIYSKMDIYVNRLALILEMMRYACGQSNKQAVGIEAIEGAIKLVEYFKNTALKVHSIVSKVSPLDKLPADKQAIYKALPKTFTTKIGLQITKNMEIDERNFERFLADKDLFKRTRRGHYEKIC